MLKGTGFTRSVISLVAASVAGVTMAADINTIDVDSRLQLKEELKQIAQDQPAKKAKPGFWLNSGDGANTLRIVGFNQTRYVANFRDRDTDDNDFAGGFETIRTRLGFKGTLIDPSINYFILADAPNGGNFRLLDAWVGKDFGNGFKMRVGQIRLVSVKECNTPILKQIFVDRSIIESRWSQCYVQGIEGSYTAKDWRFVGTFHDGMRSFNDGNRGDQWAVTGRVEVKPLGEWKFCDDFCSSPKQENLLVMGAAVTYQDGGTIPMTGSTASYSPTGSLRFYKNGTEMLQWTADVFYGHGGASVFAAVVGNHEDRPNGAEYDQIGFVVQGGVFVTDDVELSVRFAWGDLDGEASEYAGVVTSNGPHTTNDEASILAFGFNKYFSGHAMKFVADVSFAFDELSGAWQMTNRSRGWLPDEPNADMQVMLRTQMQFVF